MEAARSSETQVAIYQTTRCHITEDINRYYNCVCETDSSINDRSFVRSSENVDLITNARVYFIYQLLACRIQRAYTSIALHNGKDKRQNCSCA
jgi:hypothetical protein